MNAEDRRLLIQIACWMVLLPCLAWSVLAAGIAISLVRHVGEWEKAPVVNSLFLVGLYLATAAMLIGRWRWLLRAGTYGAVFCVAYSFATVVIYLSVMPGHYVSKALTDNYMSAIVGAAAMFQLLVGVLTRYALWKMARNRLRGFSVGPLLPPPAQP